MNNLRLNYVYHIANKLDIPVKTINNIHDRNKSIYLIESDVNKYILKLCRNFSRKNVFIKKLNENYLNIEILVYEYLYKEKGKNFKVPRVVSWEKNKYILLEYIDFENKFEIDNVSSDLIEAFVDFNTIGSNINIYNDYKGKIYNYYSRHVVKILTNTFFKLRKIYGINIFFRVLRVVIHSTKKQIKLSEPFLLHRDIGLWKNNIHFKNNQLYLIDFESCILEKKWVLKDIIDIASGLNLEVDIGIIDKYLEKIENKGFNINQINLKIQLRISLIHSVINTILLYEKLDKSNKEKYYNFLVDILLEDKKYDEWYATIR